MDKPIGQTLEEEMAWYATRGARMRSYLTIDEANHVYAVIALPSPGHPRGVLPILVAKLLGDMVVIYHDNTDRPLYEALQKMGVPRDRIVLAYAGEPIPEPVAG